MDTFPRQPRKWGGYREKVLDKTPVVVSQSQKAADLCCISRPLPTDNCLYLGRVYLDPFACNHMAQELYSLKPELTLVELGK